MADSSSATRDDAAIQSSRAFDAIDDPIESPGEADESLTAPGAATEPRGPDAGSTGEIDEIELLDQILRSPESLVATLELAIMSGSGAADVEIDFNPELLHRGDASPILYGGRTLGVLVASSLDEATRERFADWAARFLAVADRMRQWRRMAYTDDLTGAWNRRYYHRVLPRTLREARTRRRHVTLLLFDIDDFKHFNDRYGHAAGDDILIEVVRLMQSVIRPSDRVCRIGGDEFAVIFYDPHGERHPGSEHPRDIRALVERFQAQIARHRFPKLGRHAPGRLTISGGLATFPWDGHDAESLYEHADQATLRAKQSGKNAIIVGPPGDER